MLYMKDILPVEGYEGLYEVSRFGDVYSVERQWLMPRGGFFLRPRKRLTQRTINGGYLLVWLSKDGRKTPYLVHRLVCHAFNGAPAQDDLEVNHLDGGRQNNVHTNLHWATKSENVLHAFRVLRRRPSREQPVVAICPKTLQVVASYRQTSMAEADGFSPSNIASCLSGRLKTSGGLIWRRASPEDLAQLTPNPTNSPQSVNDH